jgi:hypothetical protein
LPIRHPLSLSSIITLSASPSNSPKAAEQRPGSTEHQSCNQNKANLQRTRAMEFATGALGTLLPKLANLLHGEYRVHKGVRKNIEFLTKELETTQAALRSVGEVPPEQLHELVKIWARDARELSYDMEDVVDTFLVRVKGPDPPSRRSLRKFIGKMKSMLAVAKNHQIGEQIKDIKERVVELAARRDRYRSIWTCIFSGPDFVFLNSVVLDVNPPTGTRLIL